MKNKLILACLVAIGLAFARPAATQSAPPEALAAAKELVAAARAADQVKALLPLILQQLKPAIVQGRPEVERDYDKIVPLMLEGMSGRLDDFADAVALIYARNFTVDELHQVTAFYRSAIGQKFLQKMPVIAQESLAMGQKLGQAIARDAQDRMKDELRKRGHNI